MSDSIVASPDGPAQAPSWAEGVYAALSDQFDSLSTDPRGFHYVTGEQVISRLNEVLGVFGWSFEVLSHAYHAELADEVVVHGRMRVYDSDSGQWIMREQFGSQKINRRRTDSKPVEVGFDYKGATTDCLKKCASLFGVGLYLYARESAAAGQEPPETTPAPAPAARTQPASAPSTSAASTSAADGSPAPALKCAECGDPLRRVEFANGNVWEPYQLANHGLAKFKRTLCMLHYRAANDSSSASPSPSS